MSTVKVNTISTWTGNDISIETGKTVSGTASQFKMTDVVQGDVLYGSAADTLSRLAPGTSGQVLQTQGAGANPQWGAGGLFSAYAAICDEKTAGSNGGTFTTGSWVTRDLNKTLFDTGSIVTISSNQFTLGAGSYLIKWSAPACQVNMHQTRLFDHAGVGAAIATGSPENAEATMAGYPAVDNKVSNRSIGVWRVSPSGSNTYSIEHYCSSTRADHGLGVGANFGRPETFTIVEIFKES